jgi:molecular chaperone GrpE
MSNISTDDNQLPPDDGSEQQQPESAGADLNPDDDQQSAVNAAGEDAVDEGAEEELPQEMSLEEQLADAEQRVLRGQAELENYRKRSQRDLAEQRRYAALPLARDLLTVMDNLQRAIEAAVKANEGEGLVSGVQMVVDQLATILGQYDCLLIEADGEAFDPNLHAAIGQAPSDEHPPGTIVQVMQAGYRMHDRVVRPAQVMVAISADETASEDPGVDDDDAGPENEAK